MKIHIYTDYGKLFGRVCRTWKALFEKAGHEVKYFELGFMDDAPLPDAGPSDVNLIVAGMFILFHLRKQGLPKSGKNVLWMLDPLTDDAGAEKHFRKAEALDTFGNKLDAIIAMSEPIEAYVRKHYPDVPVSRIPYVIDASLILKPVPENERTTDLLMIGHKSTRRLEAEKLFAEKKTPVKYVWGGMWGDERDKVWGGSRISLSIHGDTFAYFDLFRAVESWAVGAVVMSESCKGYEAFGVEVNRHIVMADFEDLPDACTELLKDAPRRQKMIVASQELLRAGYTPEKWLEPMLNALENA